jgi:hypothetical protein
VLRKVPFIASEKFINVGLQQVNRAAHLLGFSGLEPADVKVGMETGHNSHEQILVRFPGRVLISAPSSR